MSCRNVLQTLPHLKARLQDEVHKLICDRLLVTIALPQDIPYCLHSNKQKVGILIYKFAFSKLCNPKLGNKCLNRRPNVVPFSRHSFSFAFSLSYLNYTDKLEQEVGSYHLTIHWQLPWIWLLRQKKRRQSAFHAEISAVWLQISSASESAW